MSSFGIAQAGVHFDAFSWFFCTSNAAFIPSILVQKRGFIDTVFNGQHDIITYNNHKIMFNR
jgi:hypothetical protein